MAPALAYCRFVSLVTGFVLLWLNPAQAQESSVLKKGSWYKLAVEKNGVYKISSDFLKSMGIDPAKTDPKKIKIYGNRGGMLPQANSEPRPEDLPENAIYVKGESDNIFNSNDYILFYGYGPDNASFDPVKGVFNYENNLYADKNFYYLTIADDNGKRIGSSENIAGSFPVIRHFNDYMYYETDRYNELKSGREWFGEKFDLTTEHAFTFDIAGVSETSTVRIVSDVMAKSYTGSRFRLLFNNVQVAEQYVLPIANYQYSEKGRHQRDTISFTASFVSAPARSSQEIRYQYIKTGSGYSIGHLDFLLVNIERKLSLYGDQTIFLSAGSTANATSQFELTGVPSNIILWDITTPYQPLIQEYSLSGGTALFSTGTSQLKQFIAFNNNVPPPQFVGSVPNQDIHALTTPNLLIVTHSSLVQQAQRLAAHRQQHGGWLTAVVTTDEIYNEFSSGRQDVTAIRDFVKHLSDKSPGTLKSLLLFGRCSYDYKDRLENNTNLVPTYESINSLHPLLTYSSDDYFGFLEDSEGNWGEATTENHTLDIGVGRLTVKNAEEAKNVVDKIIYYDTHPGTLGQWRKNIVFVADDGDFNEHQKQADQLAQLVDTDHPHYTTDKIFIDRYQQVLHPSGERVPQANKKILESLDNGALIINYTGHGGEKLLAQERIFDDFVIETLANKNLPLFVTATCEFGRHDDPWEVSSAELCVLRPASGAIGMVTTTRPVNSGTNFELNKAFYEALFQLEDGRPLTLGEIFRRTKNNSISGVANRNFSLLADPSLTLAFPRFNASVTAINTTDDADTLKALSHVKVTGEITNENAERIDNFNGILHAILFDKETKFTTLGNENAPFSFRQWHNALFRGKAKVTAGVFEFEFIVPKNIAYQIGRGKLSLYAFDDNHYMDAVGASLDFVVGKSETNITEDSTPPAVSLFMGDSTFFNGGITSPNTTLVARLTDDSGINVSDYGIGNNIIAILDGKETFVVSNYYEADADDFTKGWIYYPLRDLAPGRHSISLKAWDTYNNPAEATVDFVVSNSPLLIIESFGNFPNPFRENTTLFFTHNRPGDDLEAVVTVHDLQGNLLSLHRQVVQSSMYQVDLVEISRTGDFAKKLNQGLYLARLVVRSLADGSKNERVAKLIIIN